MTYSVKYNKPGKAVKSNSVSKVNAKEGSPLVLNSNETHEGEEQVEKEQEKAWVPERYNLTISNYYHDQLNNNRIYLPLARGAYSTPR